MNKNIFSIFKKEENKLKKKINQINNNDKLENNNINSNIMNNKITLFFN